jgi:hypothetical protein
MRVTLAVSLGALCLACSACAPIYRAVRTSVVQPIIYSRYRNEAVDCIHNYLLAKEALDEYEGTHGGEVSKDFACGFKDGYARYLYEGGPLEPPPLAPRCYWNSCYENPEGHQAMLDWFAGWREGAAVAKASGFRDLVVVPTSSPPLPPPEGTAASMQLSGAPGGGPGPIPPPGSAGQLYLPEETLPPPRVAPDIPKK